MNIENYVRVNVVVNDDDDDDNDDDDGCVNDHGDFLYIF